MPGYFANTRRAIGLWMASEAAADIPQIVLISWPAYPMERISVSLNCGKTGFPLHFDLKDDDTATPSSVAAQLDRAATGLRLTMRGSPDSEIPSGTAWSIERQWRA